MDEKYIEELKLLIPSETVRKYVIKKEWVFSDRQKACILYYHELPIRVLNPLFRELRDNTHEVKLKEELTEFLDIEERGFKEFRDNSDKCCIYVATEELGRKGDFFPQGYFFDCDEAYEFIAKRLEKEQNLFILEKQLIHGADIPEKYLKLSDAPFRYAVSSVEFDKNGEAIYLYSREVPHPKDLENKNFDNMFFEVPNPFDRGDIVRYTVTGEYGIVETSQKQWHEHLEERQDPEKHSDSNYVCDSKVHVAFPQKDGLFKIKSIIPIYLERYCPKWSEEDSMALDNFLLAASKLYKGKGGLNDMYYYTLKHMQNRICDEVLAELR